MGPEVTALTGEALASIVFAAITFIVVPAILAVTEYRLTRNGKQQGLFLVVGVFVSALFLGVYSLAVGALLLTVRPHALSNTAIKAA